VLTLAGISDNKRQNSTSKHPKPYTDVDDDPEPSPAIKLTKRDDAFITKDDEDS
jgi:hypothetical protein